MIQDLTPAEVRDKMKGRETFVVNIHTTWCPDCTERQKPNFPEFAEKMKEAGVPVFQCCVQNEKLVFISDEHKALTDEFGGHGYPRTVLICEGQLADSRVEAMDALTLSMLADEFVIRLGQ